MAIRTIPFTVSKTGISPSTQQNGGVQGSHNVVQLSFTLDSGLQEALSAVLTDHPGSTLLYRFDGHSGSGMIESTVPEALTVSSTPLTYDLENWITRDAGNIQVYLVITLLKDDDTKMELYSFPALLKIKPIPTDLKGYQDKFYSVATLLQMAENAADEASDSADAADRSARDAGGYASTAAEKAIEAAGFATAAEIAKGIAEGAASTAGTSATNAHTYAGQAESAKDAAVSAKNDAVSAKEAAVSAKGDAERAQGKAEAAQSAAETAASTAVAAKVESAPKIVTDAAGVHGVRIDGVSPNSETIGVRVWTDGAVSGSVHLFGKNLFQRNYAHSYYGGGDGAGTWSGNTFTTNGVSFTVNSDGSVTATGTATGGDADFKLNVTSGTPSLNTSLPLGGLTFTLSGCPVGGSDSTYCFFSYNHNSPGQTVFDVGAGVTSNANAGSHITANIRICNGYAISGSLTFYPQIELGSAVTDYEPSVAMQSAALTTVDQTVSFNAVKPTSTIITDNESSILFASYNDDHSTFVCDQAVRTVYIGDNIVSAGASTVPSGWSGTLADGYSHSGSETGALVIPINSEPGAVYYVDFALSFGSYSSVSAVAVKLGDSVAVDTYDGSNHPHTIVRSVGYGSVSLIPMTSSNFTVSNLSVRRVYKQYADGLTPAALALSNVALRGNLDNLYNFWNVVLNDDSLKSENSSRTIAIGQYTLRRLEGGNRNVAIGTFSMSQMTEGEANIGIGADAMLAVKKGVRNIAIGHGAMYYGGNGTDVPSNNIAIGHNAMRCGSTSSAKENVAIGEYAGYGLTSGANNILIGRNAGYRITEGSRNTVIGNGAFIGESGTNYTNTDCTIIGDGAKISHASASNATAIGYNAEATKPNQMVFGNGSVTETVLHGSIIVPDGGVNKTITPILKVLNTTDTDVFLDTVANAHYFYGTLSSLTVQFPSFANNGDEIDIMFKSGSTATTAYSGQSAVIDTTNAVIKETYAPSANVYVEINARFCVDKWVVLVTEV